jgi:hypothetical protein
VYETYRDDAHAYHRINGKLRSFLSEFRAFLDYAETYLKKEYGKDSEQVTRLIAIRSREYDANPSYRFVYKLRNYAQHFDVPINGLSVQSGELDTKTGIGKKLVSVNINRDELLNSGFDWKKVQRDIEGFPDIFALNPHLDATIESLGKINLAVIVTMLPDITKAAEYIDRLVQPLIPLLEGKQGTPAVVHWDAPQHVKVGEQVRMQMQAELIPADLARSVLGLPEPDELAQFV